MKKISIMALHLGYGGIEKCIVNLANFLCSDYDVEILCVYKLYDSIPFKLDDKVKVKYLLEKYQPNREAFKEAIRKLRPIEFIKESYLALLILFLRRRKMVQELKKSDADIIISTRVLFNGWLGKYARNDIKKIGWEHNHHHGNLEYAKKFIESCKKLDDVVLVSESLKTYYKKLMKEHGYKCRCIYIPNSLDTIPSKVSKLDGKKLVSVGRLAKEKGFPDLIDVFKTVHDKNQDVSLDIVGDGAQKNMIIDATYRYKLNKEVRFHGFQDKEYIDKILDKSSIFLMTSYTESFGIVLIEAMSHGVPCIAFDSAEGANDLIKDGENGYLIKNRDKEKMADAILELLSNRDRLENMGINARNSSLNYSSDVVKKEWLTLLKKR